MRRSSLFNEQSLLSLAQRTSQAVDSLSRAMCTHQISISWSGGKDSSVVLGLVFQAAHRLTQTGVEIAPILIVHGDTTVENPEIRAYAHAEVLRLREYGLAHNLPLEVLVATPTLSESWQCRVIGGRALPAFPGTNHDCSTDMKIQPMRRLRKAVALNGMGTVLTVIGTRFEESPAREQRMRERGETADQPWIGEDGSLYLSPIAHWTMEDVWEYLGECRAENPDYLTFSTFEDVFRIYADSAGTSCAVVGDLATQAQSKPCGARTGCWCCTPIGRDKSLETMLSSDPRYSYLRGLNRLQQFLVNTRWDLSRRNWLGRSVDAEGYVSITPDVYSPAMLKDLLRYTLTLDALEQEAALREGVPPRFQVINARSLLAIDAMWNLQGYHPPFEALRVYQDVFENGARYTIPEVPEFPRVCLPKARWLFVGNPWNEQTQLIGLRDPIAEAFSEDSYCMGAHSTRDGRTVMDVHTSVAFDMDEDGVNDFFTFERDRVLEESQRNPLAFGPTGGYLYYARMGILSLAPTAISTTDAILRRTWWKHQQGLLGEVALSALLERSTAEKRPGTGGSDLGKTRQDASDARSTSEEAFSRHGKSEPTEVPPRPQRDWVNEALSALTPR